MYKHMHMFLCGRWLHSPFPKLHCFQDTHSCCTLPVEALANVICMGSCPILEQHLTWFTGSREVMQVLDLIHRSTTKKKARCTMKVFFEVEYQQSHQNSAYLRLLNGDLGISAVGTICSPGLTHMMGPSSLWDLQSSFRLDRLPHGKVICTDKQNISREVRTML